MIYSFLSLLAINSVTEYQNNNMMSSNGPLVETADKVLPHVNDVISVAKECLQSNANYADPERNQFFCPLAVHFGDFSESSVKAMDKTTHLMITTVLRYLKKTKGLESYQFAEDALLRSRYTDSTFYTQHVSSEVITGASNDPTYKFSDNPTDNEIKEILATIRAALADTVVSQDLKIDEAFVQNLLRVANKHLTVMKKDKTNRDNKPVFYIAVLRFPELNREYFKLYELSINVVYDIENQVFDLPDSFHLHVSVRNKSYPPSHRMIAQQLNAASIDVLARESLKFFGFGSA